MQNKAVLLILTICLAASAVYAEEHGGIVQSSTGDQSPPIKAGGNVSVNYGLDEKQLEAMLKRHEGRIVGELKKTAKAGDEKKRLLLERQLNDVSARLANIEKSYKEEMERRKAADEALAQLRGQLSEAQIERTQKVLRQGDTQAAEQVFDAINNPIAAFQSGQLAEGRMDYEKALRQYGKAVSMAPDNPRFLMAAGSMAMVLGEYDQAQNHLDRLMEIKAVGNPGLNLAGDADDRRLVMLLANLYSFQGKYAAAASLRQKALAIFERSLGKEIVQGSSHPDMVVI